METDAMYIPMEKPLAKSFTMEIVLRHSMYCTQTLCASIEKSHNGREREHISSVKCENIIRSR